MATSVESRDAHWMGLAVRRAWSATGATYPNPCVGAVIVRHDRLLAAAHSDPTGGPHAEVKALRAAGKLARGATMYVTLEPCPHVGLTPPCTDAIIASKIARVVVGLRDPAAHVRGKGIRRLRAAGIDVVEGAAEVACLDVHEHYMHHVRTGIPFVTLKSAASLDGRIACASGDSQWITGEAARKHGHRERARHHAVAIGVGTVLADDPRLNVRLVRGHDPVIVVFDTHLRCASVRPWRKIARPGTIVLHGSRVKRRDCVSLEARGVVCLEVALDAEGHVDVVAALALLGSRSIRSLLVEGGGALVGAFVAAQSWNRMLLYQAPRLLGEGIAMLRGVQWARVEAAPRVQIEHRVRLGSDTLLSLRPTARNRSRSAKSRTAVAGVRTRRATGAKVR